MKASNVQDIIFSVWIPILSLFSKYNFIARESGGEITQLSLDISTNDFFLFCVCIKYFPGREHSGCAALSMQKVSARGRGWVVRKRTQASLTDGVLTWCSLHVWSRVGVLQKSIEAHTLKKIDVGISKRFCFLRRHFNVCLFWPCIWIRDLPPSSLWPRFLV